MACSCPRSRQRLRLRGQSPRMQQGTLELWSGLLRNRTQGAFINYCLLSRKRLGATSNSSFLPSRRLGAAPTSHFVTRQRLEAETERQRRNSNRRHEMQRAPSHCPSDVARPFSSLGLTLRAQPSPPPPSKRNGRRSVDSSSGVAVKLHPRCCPFCRCIHRFRCRGQHESPP